MFSPRVPEHIWIALAPLAYLLTLKVLLDYLQPMITIQHPTHPSVWHIALNELNRHKIDLSWPSMTSNDYQWLPMQWLAMTTKDYQRLSKTIKDYRKDYRKDYQKDYPFTIGWLSVDYPMTIRWLSDDYPMRLSNDYPMTIKRLSNDYPMNIQWLWEAVKKKVYILGIIPK